jgi:L-lactate dehydrogenase (cytochrome)
LKPPPTAVPATVEKGERPPLTTIINTYDFEEAASYTLNKKTWAFYSSAATDLITRDANKSMLDRIWLRPRVMRNVKEVSTRSSMLGCDVDFPLFVSPAAMAKLVHPDGEKAIAAACATHKIPQCVSFCLLTGGDVQEDAGAGRSYIKP